MARGRQSNGAPPPRFTPESFLAWFPVVMRYGALAGVLHQALWKNFDRPSLLAVYGAMMGLGELAAAIREQRNGKNGGK